MFGKVEESLCGDKANKNNFGGVIAAAVCPVINPSS